MSMIVDFSKSICMYTRILTSLIIAVDSGFEACPSAGLGLGAILLRVLLAGTVPSIKNIYMNNFYD